MYIWLRLFIIKSSTAFAASWNLHVSLRSVVFLINFCNFDKSQISGDVNSLFSFAHDIVFVEGGGRLRGRLLVHLPNMMLSSCEGDDDSGRGSVVSVGVERVSPTMVVRWGLGFC